MLLPKTGRWRFRSYVDDKGGNLVNQKMTALGASALGSLVTVYKFRVTAGKNAWCRPHTSSLGDNIYVIRFTDKTGMQHRFFGFFDDPNNRFVICLYGTEKDNVYEPDNYIGRVNTVRALILAKPDVRVGPCCFDPDSKFAA